MTPTRVYQLVQTAAAKARRSLSVELGDGDISRIAKEAEVEFRLRPQQVDNVVRIAGARASSNMVASISQDDIATIARQAEIEAAQVPILFLHWLENPADPREAEAVAAAVQNDIAVRYEDVADRNSVLRVIRDWLRDNKCAQYLFLGAHGDEDGLGDHVATGIDWPELGTLLGADPSLLQSFA